MGNPIMLALREAMPPFLFGLTPFEFSAPPEFDASVDSHALPMASNR
jgi:hypothetical protein